VTIEREWWRGGVLYNAYPRSWSDSNGDGVGDLAGIVERLDHLEWLGVAGLWLNPITPSPDRDWGYDVSDYCSVHPDFGDLDDLDTLVAEARRRGIALVLDLVPSHTSCEHEWFAQARRSRTSPYRHYYVWSGGNETGAPPNNWVSYFGGPAWTRDDVTGDFYMHNFSPYQPQLNWWNPDVATEFDRILRWWFDRGVAGMRIDAVQALFQDARLRDNPSATLTDTSKEQALGQRFFFNANRPEVHDVLRRWRALADSYGTPRLLFGETWVPSIEQLASYYGTGTDELNLAWNLPFLSSPWRAPNLQAVIADTLKLIPPGALASWAMSTHDGEGRGATRWCGNDPEAIRCALVLLLSLPGTPILYYGDEIGMPDARIDRITPGARDTVESVPREASRTPMQWANCVGGGFTTSATPWLPLGEVEHANVADQYADPDSTLRLCRDLTRFRRENSALSRGRSKLLPAPAGVILLKRGENAVVAVNIGPESVRIDVGGTVAIGTDRGRDAEVVHGQLLLRSNEAVVLKE
jgi:alpha-glucosidase